MDYGSPKTLPNTGAVAVLGLSLWLQFWLALAAGLTVAVAIVLIRRFWRRNKQLNDQ